MPSIGESIRIFRKKHGWTQPELAKRVNKSTQVISNWERGYTSLDHDDVAKLAAAFDISADDLLGENKRYYEGSKNHVGEITVREGDSNYTVVARSKNLPPQKIRKLEKLLDLLFEEDEEDDNK